MAVNKKVYKHSLTMFIMKKKIKKYGNSAVIVLTRDNLEVYDLKIDDIIDIEIVKTEKGGKE